MKNLIILLVLVITVGCEKKYSTTLGTEEVIQEGSVVTMDGHRSAGKVVRIVTGNGQRIAEFTATESAESLMRQGIVRIAGGTGIDLRSDLATGNPLKSGSFVPIQSELDYTVKKWSGHGLALAGFAAIVVALALARFLFARSLEHFLPLGLALALALITAYVGHPVLMGVAKKIHIKVESMEAVSTAPEAVSSTPSNGGKLDQLKSAEKDFNRFISTPTGPRLGAFFVVFLVSFPAYVLLIAWTKRQLLGST